MLLYSLLVDLFAGLGVFVALSRLIDHLGTDKLSEIGKSFKELMPETIFLILFLGCWVGVPPLPGFIGRFVLIGAAFRQQYYVLALVAVVASGLCLLAALKLCYELVARHGAPTQAPVDVLTRRAVFLVYFFPLLFLTLFAQGFLHWASSSLRMIFW